MRLTTEQTPDVEGFSDIAQQTFLKTEAMLKERSLSLPYPSPKALPWSVNVAQAPIDSRGGAWRVVQGGKGRYGLVIIASVEVRADDQLWYHVSLSRDDRMPTYEDITWVKEAWMGDLWAIQCFVPKREHVNQHPYCLHLWHCMTAPRPFPNFNVLGNI